MDLRDGDQDILLPALTTLEAKGSESDFEAVQAFGAAPENLAQCTQGLLIGLTPFKVTILEPPFS